MQARIGIHLAPGHGALENKLLGTLSPADFALMESHLVPVDLPLRRQLEKPGRRIDHAYFINRGLASLLANYDSTRSIEVGMIGSEGMSGLPLLLGSDIALHDTLIQIAGRGWRITAEDLAGAMASSPTLQRSLLRFVTAMLSQTSCTAVATARFKIDERLARWLLMAHDRAEGDSIALTHEFLAIMMGVRRPGVTVALRAFEKRGFLIKARGIIEIMDRSALEAAANGCYGTPEAEYRRLFEEPGIVPGA